MIGSEHRKGRGPDTFCAIVLFILAALIIFLATLL